LNSPRYILPFLLLAALLLSCSRRDTIVVGAKAFTEGYLLGHMAAMVLEDAGYDVEEQFGLATAAMRGALESGQLDIYYEYTGTAYTVYAGGSDQEVMTDSARVLRAVRDYDSSSHDLIWLKPLPFNDTYALLMRDSTASGLRIGNLSDLAREVNTGRQLDIAVDAEFYERPDGLKALLRHYGFPERNIVKLDAGLAYKALISGEVQVGMGYSTDGRIPAYNLRVLDDDRFFFPAYNPAAVVRRELLQRKPEVRAVLERLNRSLDNETIRQLNAEVDIHHRDPRKVARRWLVERGIIGE